MVYDLFRPCILHVTDPSIEHAHCNYGWNVLWQQLDQAKDHNPISLKICLKQLVEKPNQREAKDSLSDYRIFERRRWRKWWSCNFGSSRISQVNQPNVKRSSDAFNL